MWQKQERGETKGTPVPNRQARTHIPLIPYKGMSLLLASVNDFVNNLMRATQNADPIIATGFFVDIPLDQVA